LTAYYLFASNVRNKMIKENPEAKRQEIAILIAQAWKDLDQKEKDKYQREFDRNKEVYLKMLAIYNNNV